MKEFEGSAYFPSLDFCQGYWQLPVHPSSYNACGIMAPHGSYSPTRVLRGHATAHFQSSVEPLFASLRENLKAWLDDLNFYSKTEDELLHLLRKIFLICKEKNLLFSAKKCTFFAKKVKWCGRIISKDGHRIEPANVESLKPLYADELCQFVHCARWMSNVIPLFRETVRVLENVLERAYKKSNK